MVNNSREHADSYIRLVINVQEHLPNASGRWIWDTKVHISRGGLSAQDGVR